MTDATCSRCGTTDGTVRERLGPALDVALCAGCYASLTGTPVDSGAGFTVAWALLVGGLLLVAVGAATYILTR